MKMFDGLMTAKVEPETYLKRLNSYRNRIIIHTGIIVITEILYSVFHVHFFICAAIAGTVLLDELWRLGFFSEGSGGGQKTVLYREGASFSFGKAGGEADFALLIFFIIIYIMFGYGVAVYFLIFEGVRMAFATYKAKKVYALPINAVTYYGIAFGFGLVLFYYGVYMFNIRCMTFKEGLYEKNDSIYSNYSNLVFKLFE